MAIQKTAIQTPIPIVLTTGGIHSKILKTLKAETNEKNKFQMRCAFIRGAGFNHRAFLGDKEIQKRYGCKF
jgi:hypothetical protein